MDQRGQSGEGFVAQLRQIVLYLADKQALVEVSENGHET